jgi:hypothetical protein
MSKPSIFRTISFFIISICSLRHANAFSQAHRHSIATRGGQQGTSTLKMLDNSNDVDDATDKSNNQRTRRQMFQRSFYSVGLALTASTANSARGNAIEFSLPNILISSDGDRGVKGMPAPIKKSSGLGYKIRSVSKVMVRYSCTLHGIILE